MPRPQQSESFTTSTASADTYVHICVYVYMYIQIHNVYIYIYTHTYNCIDRYIYIYIQISVSFYISAHDLVQVEWHRHESCSPIDVIAKPCPHTAKEHGNYYSVPLYWGYIHGIMEKKMDIHALILVKSTSSGFQDPFEGSPGMANRVLGFRV